MIAGMRYGVVGGVLVAMIPMALAGCRGPAPSGATRTAAAGSDPAAVPTTTAEPARAEPAVASGRRVQALAITVLSTTKAPVGKGEWGFAALVEADGQRILFDTGAEPDTVLHNAETLGIDLSAIPMVVLSHHHDDHVGGLMTLRRAVVEQAPSALATVHVGAGMFAPRRRGTKAFGAAGDELKRPPKETHEINEMIAVRPVFEATGGTFVVHDRPAEIAPGVWVTGPVPRVHPERNWSGTRKIEGPEGGWIEDTLPEDQALVIDTDEGLVVLSGCGHSGIVNGVAHARASIREAPIRAAMGGFHLMDATPAQLAWTGEQLHAVGLHEFLGAHCTGGEAVQRFGQGVVAAGGRSLELGVGERFSLPAP
jgi:7,8-dihydropterin-6-yl-methyl-4-(beta-D-ribofuranosyl)aminobenzene 5'-phosphate synthase